MSITETPLWNNTICVAPLSDPSSLNMRLGSCLSWLLALKSNLPEPNRKLCNALDEAGFSIFQPIADLGYSGWKPAGEYRATLDNVTASDMKNCIDPAMTPPSLVSMDDINDALPLSYLQNLPPQKVQHRYPHAQYFVASLHTALTQRGLEKRMVDFYFGGSMLELLATQKIDQGFLDGEQLTSYMVALVPGTEIIMVFKLKDYVQDYSFLGFQLERYITGSSFEDLHDTDLVEHVQLMDIDGHRVLFAAEIDAMDENGDPVQVKGSDPFYWGTKVLLQMISSGSVNMCHGSRKQQKLVTVKLMTLQQIAQKAFSKRKSIATLERNIVNGLLALKEAAYQQQIEDGKVYEILFTQSRKMELRPSKESIHRLFPKMGVMNDLLP